MVTRLNCDEDKRGGFLSAIVAQFVFFQAERDKRLLNGDLENIHIQWGWCIEGGRVIDDCK